MRQQQEQLPDRHVLLEQPLSREARGYDPSPPHYAAPTGLNGPTAGSSSSSSSSTQGYTVFDITATPHSSCSPGEALTVQSGS